MGNMTNKSQILTSPNFMYFLKFILLIFREREREREREHVQAREHGGGAERGGKKEIPRQVLHGLVQSLLWGLNSQTVRS